MRPIQMTSKCISPMLLSVGSVDISFNLISIDEVKGKELSALGLDDYLRPIHIAARAFHYRDNGRPSHGRSKARRIHGADGDASAVGSASRRRVWHRDGSNRRHDANAGRRTEAKGRAGCLVTLGRVARKFRSCCARRFGRAADRQRLFRFNPQSDPAETLSPSLRNCRSRDVDRL